MDKYYQIVKCFRDEDLRADRQPEFTQVDCEMSFVEQEDVIRTFEGLFKYLLKEIRGIEIDAIPRMTYADAMRLYGSDKPDLRFDMRFHELNESSQRPWLFRIRQCGFGSRYRGGRLRGLFPQTDRRTDRLGETPADRR